MATIYLPVTQLGQERVPVHVAILKCPAAGSGNYGATGLSDAPHGNAKVLRFNFYNYSLGGQRLDDGIGHLAGQSLLYLGPPRGDLQAPGQLADARDAAIGDISDMGDTEKWEQVMFAHGMEDDVAQYHWIVVILVKNGIDGIHGVYTHPGE